ncbi:hypothetical protein BDW42DRAFT_162124 [Aspergillus taichungensis]|uniref:N-acetylgalactosaminide beta-1,3-galactosyltransferase n=1 Tax=Aspergillus taichungensis TaxID=482145 RepID=A0A2J5I4F3_9EURO|nr:hypothetical protein BDW42DRAFT_162124 [Aspergillus taichungensis]
MAIRLSRRWITALILLCGFTVTTTFLHLGLNGSSLIPSDLYHHVTPEDDGPPPPDYWEWETFTRFAPAPRTPPGAGASDENPDDHICDSFPTEILSRVQVVLKMGASEPAERINPQIETVTRCIKNLLIVSDREGELRGHRVHDILATLPPSFRVNTTDFDTYEAAKRGDPASMADTQKGWNLDRFKFLPMVERAYDVNPTAQWFVFLESDTYVVWDNLFRLLDQFNPDRPLYFGSPSPGRVTGDGEVTWFAYGGAGIVLSAGAIDKAVERTTGAMGELIQPSLSVQFEQVIKEDCCGDSVLGWVLFEKGVRLSGMWPMFQPHPLHGVPFDGAYWCQPVITMHKTLPADMYGFMQWENRRDRSEPLLYSDLYEYTKLGTFDHRTDWDNGDWGGWQEPPEAPGHASFEACGTACHDHPDCKGYTYDTSGHCIFIRTMRLGSSKKLLGTTARLSAGWDVGKMKQLQEELNADCKRPRWVKPSITRIF